MFDKINRWYNEQHLWTKEMVYNAVGRRITAEEYERITGEKYETSEETNEN